MMLRAFLCIVVLLFPGVASASLTTVYVAQTAAGLDNGTGCANAHAVSFFNTADSWGAGSSQIGPGTTVHLCGTFTGTAGVNMLTTRGSGTAGAANAITIVFEPGAKLTAPHWGTAAALVSNHNFLVIDGGSNGIIEATDNGTALGNQVVSHAIQLGVSGANVHDIEIKNLTIANMCVRQRNSANTTCAGDGVKLANGGGNVLIHDNTIHDVGFAIGFIWSVSAVGDSAYRNTVYNMFAGVQASPCANGINVTGFTIHDNDFSGVDAWEDPADAFHHDHIHTYNCGGTSGTLSSPLVYNNYFHGDFANHTTAAIYFEHLGTGATAFNNLVTPSAGATTDANIFSRNGTSAAFYNNTIVCPTTTTASGLGFLASTGGTVKNNIVVNCLAGINVQDVGSQNGLLIDRNVYFAVSRWASPLTYTSFATWQAGTGQDANSTTNNPNLDGTYHLQSGSSAIGLGTNLTSVGIVPLTVGKPTVVGVAGLTDGLSRPVVTAWNDGAYTQLSGTGKAPTRRRR